MKLGISNEEIARRITSNPALQTAEENSTARDFDLALRNMGTTEQRFVSDQRQVALRHQPHRHHIRRDRAAETWLDAINQFQNEQRSIDYVRSARRKPATSRRRPPISSANISTSARSCSARRNTARSKPSR